MQTLALIPWFLGMGYLAYRSWPEIRILGKEITGAKHLPGYVTLMDVLQRHRGWSYLYLTAPERKELRPRLEELERRFQDTFKEIEGALKEDQASEIKELEAVKTQFLNLRISVFQGSPEENFWSHSRLILMLLGLMESEGHRHALFQDPDLYVRTLAEVALIELPKLIEILGRIRGLGSGYLAQEKKNPALQKTLFRLYATANGYGGALEWTVKNIRFPTETILLLKTAYQELSEFLTQSETLISLRPESPLAPSTYFQIASGVIDTFLEVYSRLTQDLIQRLNQKKRSLIRDWFLSILLLSFMFIFFCSSFYLSYRDVMRKLRVISQGAERIAQGDLSARIELDSADEIGKVAQVLNQSVRALKQNLERIYFLHYYDRLTGLPNRDKLLEELLKAEAPALFLLDIHNFKDLNYVCGEDCGDQILKDLASKLRQIFPFQAYRVGPDEFAVLADLGKEGLSREAFLEMARKGLKKLEEAPFYWKKEEIYLNFFSAAVSDCAYPEKLLVFAYDALKEGKKNCEKLSILVSPQEKRKPFYEERMLWIKKTRQALQEGRIIPYYQPIFHNTTGKIEKFEALVRMIEDDGTVIPPSKFLEISKKVGLYPEITKQVIQRALADFKDLPFKVSINLSFQDFESAEVKEFLLQHLQGAAKEKFLVEPQRMVFEVLETEQIRNYALVLDFLQELKRLGCQITVDDFGSGYSNLERLIELRIDYLKLDGSLIRRLPQEENVRVLVGAVVNFARQVGIKTIAEFVADEEIYRWVKKLEIDYSQGFYLGPPEPIEVVRKKYLA